MCNFFKFYGTINLKLQSWLPTVIFFLEYLFSERNCNNNNENLLTYHKTFFTPSLHILESVCKVCKQFLQNSSDLLDLEVATLSTCLHLGVLKNVSRITDQLEHTESVIQKILKWLLQNTIVFNNVPKQLHKQYCNKFPKCCSVLKYLLEPYVTMRRQSSKTCTTDTQKIIVSYSTKSVNKKTVLIKYWLILIVVYERYCERYILYFKYLH